ncbi:hypothetical protein F4678DRAFT_469339 [Xylaria arbuscula]|nr:hypothetical protein F4678DRAFT_469339 [Xylaria arbuscula]
MPRSPQPNTKSKYCSRCNKTVSKANFARHQRWHQNAHQVTCPVYAYKKEIQRAGGLSQLQSTNTSIWNGIGLRAPFLFPATECWVEKPTRQHYMSDLILNSNEGTAVFRRGSPRQPLDSLHIFDVIQQLDHPDIGSAICAVNMTAQLPKARIPERLYGKFPIYEESLEVKTNITPKFSGLDLHVDCGAHGITLLHSACVKLWALYPLTEKNYSLLAEVYKSNAMFIELQGRLEGGEFCIQTEEDAIYLPPGCIHSTITLRGGLTPGIMFTTAECVKPAGLIWDMDNNTKRHRDDCVYFLRAIELGLCSRDEDQRQEALSELCGRYRQIAKVRRGEMSILSSLPRQCCRCNKLWSAHR